MAFDRRRPAAAAPRGPRRREERAPAGWAAALAAVLLLAAAGPAAAGETGRDLDDSDFARFVRRAEASSEAATMVAELLLAQETLPIIEGDDIVHFVYSGARREVGLRGSMTDSEPGDPTDPLRRIAGTRVFYRSYRVSPEARWDYRFVVDGEFVTTDPRNPLVAPGRHGRGVVSELRMPRYQPPAHIRSPVGRVRGHLEDAVLDSEALGERRRVRVYLPPGYAPVGHRYPLLVVADGLLALQVGQMENTLDNLIHESVAPMAAAFVESRNPAELSGRRAARYAQLLAEDLVPMVESRYYVGGSPEARAVYGADDAAVAALLAALHFPGTFGRIALQSAPLRGPEGEALVEALRESAEPPGEIYLEWGRWEFRSARLGWDRREDARRLGEVLRARGLGYYGGEIPEGSGWGSWRAHTAQILEAFFPRVLAGARSSASLLR